MRRTIGCFAISGCVGLLLHLGGRCWDRWASGRSEARARPGGRGEESRGQSGLSVQHQESPPFEEGEACAVPGQRRRFDGAAIAAQKQALVERASRASRAQPAQANRAPLTQQFTNQARPLLRAELIFARNVCQLNREELRKVNRDAPGDA